MVPLRRRALYVLAGAGAALALAMMVYLALHDPASSPAPQCVVKRLTGWDCPGCGSQRAFHALVRGDIAAAWRFNAAVFFAVPLAALYIFAPRRWRPALNRPAAIIAIAAAIVLWTIWRNI